MACEYARSSHICGRLHCTLAGSSRVHDARLLPCHPILLMALSVWMARITPRSHATHPVNVSGYHYRWPRIGLQGRFSSVYKNSRHTSTRSGVRADNPFHR
ncbi:hypothetical protein C8Q77DRAFT_1096167 [Trametes polyzona]|nr:hypothetical protein C8Q77DRAFT_1096167 [Trametes polyzona]